MFENEADANITEAKCDFIKQKNISSDPTQRKLTQPIKKNRDGSVASAECVLYGSCMSGHSRMEEINS